MKLNQKGFVDLAFVAVLVVLVVATAFTMWKINQTDETVSDTEANTQFNDLITQNDDSKEENAQLAGVMIEEPNGVICEGAYSANVPMGWFYYYQDPVKSNADCTIESYSPDDPGIPSVGDYAGEVDISIFVVPADSSLEELKTSVSENVGKVNGADGPYPVKTISVNDTQVGSYDAVLTTVEGGFHRNGIITNIYEFIVNNSHYTISFVSEKNYETELADFINTFTVN